MFNSIATLFLSSLFLSCNNGAETKPTEQDNMRKVASDTVPVTKTGSDRDEHGCIGSAGYQWSVVKDSCIRIFETGIKMEAVSADKTMAAFVVFSNDMVRAEIFLPTQKKPVVIRKSSREGDPPKWANGPLALSFSNGKYELAEEGKIVYSGYAGK